jgi:TatD DNase family protein
MLTASERYRQICYPMIGLHPTSVREDYTSQLDKLFKLADTHQFIAVGEIGIDLYWDKTFLKEQLDAFRKQINFAIERDLPIVVHSRESFQEVFSVLYEYKGSKLKGVLHAFTGTAEDAEKAIGLGFKLGIGGIVTFKNSGLDKIVKITGPEHLILETDSPYLAPVPYRGKRNESSYICIINKRLSEIFGMSEEEVASITYSGSVSLFRL